MLFEIFNILLSTHSGFQGDVRVVFIAPIYCQSSQRVSKF